MTDREREDERRKRTAADESKVELVAAIKRARRRGDGVGALYELLAHLHADRHVLAGLEWCWHAIWLDPDAGERVGIVDACCEGGVIGRVIREDAERGGGRCRLCHGASSLIVRRSLAPSQGSVGEGTGARLRLRVGWLLFCAQQRLTPPGNCFARSRNRKGGPPNDGFRERC